MSGSTESGETKMARPSGGASESTLRRESPPLAFESRTSKMARLVASPTARVFAALLFVLAVGLIFNADGAFFKLGTHRDALRQASVYGILACGLTLVIISGGIDLAVGSLMALVAVVCAKMAIHWGWSG